MKGIKSPLTPLLERMRDEISNILYSSFRLHPSSFIKRGKGGFKILLIKINLKTNLVNHYSEL